MNLLKILILSSLITSCATTVPVTAKFPDAPKILFETCPQLKTIDTETTTMSILTKTVRDNYSTYYECSVKMDGWIEWYQVQKKIFEEISK